LRTAPRRITNGLRQDVEADVAERVGRREGAVLARHGVGLGVVQEHLARLELLDGDVALRGEARAGGDDFFFGHNFLRVFPELRRREGSLKFLEVLLDGSRGDDDGEISSNLLRLRGLGLGRAASSERGGRRLARAGGEPGGQLLGLFRRGRLHGGCARLQSASEPGSDFDARSKQGCARKQRFDQCVSDERLDQQRSPNSSATSICARRGC